MPKRNQSPNQLANLKPNKWPKGKSGNPKGRPPIIPDLRILLGKVLSEEKMDMTAAEVIIRSLLKKALSGDVRAAEVLLERGWGKVVSTVDVTSDGKRIQAPSIIVNGNPPAE